MNQALTKVNPDEMKTIERLHFESPYIPKDALEIVETRNKLFDKIMATAITATGFADWVDQDGKPYLQSSGAEKIARRFGVRVYDVEVEREDFEDELGKYYLYTVSGKATLGDRDTIEAFGTCSSRDKFFGKKNGQYKAIQDVDLPNIKKKAYTNFFGNVVTRLLGLRNLTWSELEGFGIKKDGKTSVRYDQGANSSSYSHQWKLSEKNAKKPFWNSEYQGKTNLFARAGQHFSPEYLEGLGFKPTQKNPELWVRTYSEEIAKNLETEFEAAEQLGGGQ